MGLMIARMAERLGTPGVKLAAATVGGTAAATGLVLGIQYGYGDDLASTQTAPTGANLAVGLGGAGAGAIAAGITSYQWLGSPYSRFLEADAGRSATMVGTGLAVGSLLGAFVVAPVVRRSLSE